MAGLTQQNDRNDRGLRLFGPSAERPVSELITVTIDMPRYTYTVELAGDVRECNVQFTRKELFDA